MPRKGKARNYDSTAPAEGQGREVKRQRFNDQRGSKQGGQGLRPTTLITIGGVAVVIVFVMIMTFGGNSSPGAVAATAVQQIPATTAGTADGKVYISEQEVREKRLVYWDYRQGSISTPMLAYVTPSGGLRMAARVCEPCNGYSFRVEGNQLVCNACETRWDLETSRGISGGCMTYPPDVLESFLEGGQLVVDEQIVADWRPRA
jgi:uncharacterized membrane protein